MGQEELDDMDFALGLEDFGGAEDGDATGILEPVVGQRKTGGPLDTRPVGLDDQPIVDKVIPPKRNTSRDERTGTDWTTSPAVGEGKEDDELTRMQLASGRSSGRSASREDGRPGRRKDQDLPDEMFGGRVHGASLLSSAAHAMAGQVNESIPGAEGLLNRRTSSRRAPAGSPGGFVVGGKKVTGSPMQQSNDLAQDDGLGDLDEIVSDDELASAGYNAQPQFPQEKLEQEHLPEVSVAASKNVLSKTEWFDGQNREHALSLLADGGWLWTQGGAVRSWGFSPKTLAKSKLPNVVKAEVVKSLPRVTGALVNEGEPTVGALYRLGQKIWRVALSNSQTRQLTLVSATGDLIKAGMDDIIGKILTGEAVFLPKMSANSMDPADYPGRARATGKGGVTSPMTTAPEDRYTPKGEKMFGQDLPTPKGPKFDRAQGLGMTDKQIDRPYFFDIKHYNEQADALSSGEIRPKSSLRTAESVEDEGLPQLGEHWLVPSNHADPDFLGAPSEVEITEVGTTVIYHTSITGNNDGTPKRSWLEAVAAGTIKRVSKTFSLTNDPSDPIVLLKKSSLRTLSDERTVAHIDIPEVAMQDALERLGLVVDEDNGDYITGPSGINGRWYRFRLNPDTGWYVQITSKNIEEASLMASLDAILGATDYSKENIKDVQEQMEEQSGHEVTFEDAEAEYTLRKRNRKKGALPPKPPEMANPPQGMKAVYDEPSKTWNLVSVAAVDGGAEDLVAEVASMRESGMDDALIAQALEARGATPDQVEEAIHGGGHGAAIHGAPEMQGAPDVSQGQSSAQPSAMGARRVRARTAAEVVIPVEAGVEAPEKDKVLQEAVAAIESGRQGLLDIGLKPEQVQQLIDRQLSTLYSRFGISYPSATNNRPGPGDRMIPERNIGQIEETGNPRNEKSHDYQTSFDKGNENNQPASKGASLRPLLQASEPFDWAKMHLQGVPAFAHQTESAVGTLAER